MRPDRSDPDKFTLFAYAQGTSRDEDFDHLLDIIRLVLTRPRFDATDVATYFLMLYRQLTQQASVGSIQVLEARSIAGLRPITTLSELSTGISLISDLTPIIKTEAFPELAQRLQRLFDGAIRRGYAQIAVHVSSQEQESLVFPKLKAFVAELNGDRPRPSFPVPEFLKEKMREFATHRKVFLQAETHINNCIWGVPFANYNSPKSPAITCLVGILEPEHIHPLIRQELGAYGAYASYTPLTATLVLVSYRNQGVKAVLDAFEKVLDLATAGSKITDETVENAVIVSFSNIDYVQPPHNRGMEAWWGTPVEILKERRARYYNLTKEEVIEVAKELRTIEPVVLVYSDRAREEVPEGFTMISLTETLPVMAGEEEEGCEEHA
jgi:Zn-dependent M16 (insulinase) family peptidase